MIEKRITQGKEASPSLLAIDSQSIKTVQFVNENIGIDGGKNINGRKRTILVDKLGLPLVIHVTAANISDNEAGIEAVKLLKGKVPRLKKLAADKGYKESFKIHVMGNYGWEVEIAPQRRTVKTRITKRICSRKKQMAG